MPLLVRNVNKDYRWFRNEEVDRLLAEGDCPSDPFQDLQTSKNHLSVYEVAPDRSNLERLVRAVAVGRSELGTVAYIVFDSTIVENAQIEITATPGDTKDLGANVHHRDLTVSGKKLVELIRGILQSGESVDYILKARLIELVEQGIEAREIPEECRQKIKKK
jgi:hypothetical protein